MVVTEKVLSLQTMLTNVPQKIKKSLKNTWTTPYLNLKLHRLTDSTVLISFSGMS